MLGRSLFKITKNTWNSGTRVSVSHIRSSSSKISSRKRVYNIYSKSSSNKAGLLRCSGYRAPPLGFGGIFRKNKNIKKKSYTTRDNIWVSLKIEIIAPKYDCSDFFAQKRFLFKKNISTLFFIQKTKFWNRL